MNNATINVHADIFDSTVEYIYLNEADEITEYINANGVPASVDKTDYEHEFSDVHEIIINEPGTLVFCPISKSENEGMDREYFLLYSDFKLLSLIQKEYTSINSNAGFSINVEPGSYYYRIQRYLNAATTTTFIGFIPANRAVTQDEIDKRTYESKQYETVDIIAISDKVDLIDYINSNGIPASIDVVDSDKELSDIHEITITESGTLVFCPISKGDSGRNDNDYLLVYSESNLTSVLLEERTFGNSFSTYSIEVEPGSYYYRIRRDLNPGRTSSFIGFIPRDRCVTQDEIDRRKYESEQFETVDIITLSNQEDFMDYINSDGTPASIDFVNYKSEFSDVHEIIINEPGTICFCPISKKEDGSNSLARLLVYSDSSLTSLLLDEYTFSDLNHYYNLMVDKGTYYYIISHDLYDAKTTTYLGFIPDSQFFSVADITYDEESHVANIDFNVDPIYSQGMIRIEKGRYRVNSLYDSNVWQESTRENAIIGTHAVIDESGVYTARLGANDLKPIIIEFVIDFDNPQPFKQDENNQLQEEVLPEDDNQLRTESEVSPSDEEYGFIINAAENEDTPSMTIDELIAQVEMLQEILEENGIEYSN